MIHTILMLEERQEMNSTFFRIAGHLVQLYHTVETDILNILPSFTDFKVEPDSSEEVILSVRLCVGKAPQKNGRVRLLSDISTWYKESFCFEEGEEHYMTTLDSEDEGVKLSMLSTKDFRYSTVYMEAIEGNIGGKCAWFIMVAFGQAVLSYRTVLFHASVVSYGSKGYAFLGKSGTGKSTHSRLWLRHIPGTQLLNDDNPAVRIYEHGEVFIYGTPWSGKAKCYKNMAVKLGAFVRLEQASVNQFDHLRGIESLLALLPSGSAIRWNAILFNKLVETLELFIKCIPVGRLSCLPDREAALLCRGSVTNDIGVG